LFIRIYIYVLLYILFNFLNVWWFDFAFDFVTNVRKIPPIEIQKSHFQFLKNVLQYKIA